MLALAASGALGGELEIEHSGQIQTDIRFRVDEVEEPLYYETWTKPSQLDRNQNFIKNRLRATSGTFSGYADIDLVVFGYPERSISLVGLGDRRQIEPIRLEAHALYLEARDLMTPGLDLRIGQQLIQFGVGDQFNPTNTVNPNDVEDNLLFGQQQANVAARLDYAFGNFIATGALIPVFKPSNIPLTSPLGLARTDRLPFVDEELRWRIHAERESAIGVFDTPTIVKNVTAQMPEANFNNMAYIFALGGWIGGQDITLSYYRGNMDVPLATSTHTTQNATETCAPNNANNCIDGLLENDVTLEFPRQQVLGFNMAGEMNPLGWVHKSLQPVGYRIEFAWVDPLKDYRHRITQDEIVFPLQTVEAGEYPYPSGKRPIVLETRPYPKFVIGLDYTLGKHVYTNVQWVHGNLDDQGAGDLLFQDGETVRAGGVGRNAPVAVCALTGDGRECAFEYLRPRQSDFVVTGIDINWMNRRGLLRLFAIWDFTGIYEERYNANTDERERTYHGFFTDEGFSAILFPELGYNFGDGLELGVGLLMKQGKDWSKFGSPEAGGSVAWTRARYSF